MNKSFIKAILTDKVAYTFSDDDDNNEQDNEEEK